MVLVAQRVHRLPETAMSIGGEIAAARERLHRLALPERGVAIDEVDHPGREHEKTAVDPAAFAARLLLEARHAIAVDIERAEARRRLHRSDRGEDALRAVIRDELAAIDVRDAVAVRE